MALRSTWFVIGSHWFRYWQSRPESDKGHSYRQDGWTDKNADETEGSDSAKHPKNRKK